MNTLGNICMGVIMVGVILGMVMVILLGIYRFVRFVIEEVTGYKTWKEYYVYKCEIYRDELNKSYRKEYELKLQQKSKEYFREFYEEEMKKNKEEKDASAEV